VVAPEVTRNGRGRNPRASSPRRAGMSPSSNGDSPLSIGTMAGAAHANVVRQFPLPNRDFSIEIPSPQLLASSNGMHSLKSPTSLKSARTPSFSREGILGSAQKARNLSQSSENRPEHVSNGLQKASSDEGVNPLKRRNTDATVDYPRRRATIAVSDTMLHSFSCHGRQVVEVSSVSFPDLRAGHTNMWTFS
jgi:hypothetical protein